MQSPAESTKITEGFFWGGGAYFEVAHPALGLWRSGALLF